MTSEAPRTYTYAEMAEEIESALGVRPALSTLRAARAEARRTAAGQSRPRLTLGMPSPQAGSTPGVAVLFLADEVDEWLSRHPWREWFTARETLEAAASSATTAEELAEPVARARKAGMSWRQITDVLNAHGPVVRTMSAVHRAYRHLDVP